MTSEAPFCSRAYFRSSRRKPTARRPSPATSAPTGIEPHRAHVQPPQAAPPHRHALRQDRPQLPELPQRRRLTPLAKALRQQGLSRAVCNDLSTYLLSGCLLQDRTLRGVSKWVEWPGLGCFQGLLTPTSGPDHVDSTTRKHHRRRATRSQSEVTEAEWRLIAPRLPQRRDEAAHGDIRCARWSKPSSTSCARGVRGARRPLTWFLEHGLPRVRRLARRLRVRADLPRPGADRSPARALQAHRPPPSTARASRAPRRVAHEGTKRARR